MSDAFYIGMRDSVAGPLIEKYGMALTLRRTVKGVYNPASGGMSADTITDYPCKAFINEFNSYMVSNGLVKRGDKQLMVSAKDLAVVPQIGDQFIGMTDGTWYVPNDGGTEVSRFQPVETLGPGGIAVMYNVQVRQ